MPDDPGTGEKVNRFLRLVAANDEGGFEFLKLWHQICHTTDDVIDENKWDAESLLEVFMLASTVYSTPFYRQNSARLQLPCLTATGVYQLSVKWEKPNEPLWHRIWADVLRHSGNDVMFAVALICGGYDHLMKICGPLYASCFVYHRDRYSTPWEEARLTNIQPSQ